MPKRSAAEQAAVRVIQDKDATRAELLEAAKILERYERRRSKKRRERKPTVDLDEEFDL